MLKDFEKIYKTAEYELYYHLDELIKIKWNVDLWYKSKTRLHEEKIHWEELSTQNPETEYDAYMHVHKTIQHGRIMSCFGHLK